MLPQLNGARFVTDGGMDTDLIFHHGVDLPEFAAFPLLEDERGRDLLAGYYDGYAAIARRAGAGLLLEAPTWRANPDWGARVGYDADALSRVNAAAIGWLAGLRDRYADSTGAVLVSGTVGPRGKVKFAPVPSSIVEIQPAWRGYEYFLVGDEIVVVNPNDLHIVAVIPA